MMKAAILETEKTTDIILKLFQPATQKESKAVSLFLLTISLLSSFLTLCIKVRESSWPQLQSSTSKGRGGGAAGAFPYGIHYCVAYLIFYHNFFGLSIWKRILLQFPRPMHTA